MDASLKGRREMAGWDDEYMLEIIAQTFHA